MKLTLKKTLIATICGLSLSVPYAAIAGGATDKQAYRDNLHTDLLEAERDALKQALPAGHSASFYEAKLAAMGFRITAINDADDDYIEYEVVKGRNSHEVQIDLDESKGVAKEVDIAANMWRADATKAALRGDTVQRQSSSEFSDRKYAKAWTDEKQVLEQALVKGQDRAFYDAKLKELGYRVTAMNVVDDDELEYEVVKGRNSYEVHVDLDEDTGKAEDVAVTRNLWHADETEAVLSARK